MSGCSHETNSVPWAAAIRLTQPGLQVGPWPRPESRRRGFRQNPPSHLVPPHNAKKGDDRLHGSSFQHSINSHGRKNALAQISYQPHYLELPSSVKEGDRTSGAALRGFTPSAERGFFRWLCACSAATSGAPAPVPANSRRFASKYSSNVL